MVEREMYLFSYVRWGSDRGLLVHPRPDNHAHRLRPLMERIMVCVIIFCITTPKKCGQKESASFCF